MNSFIIHDSICSLIPKKCHPKRCHSDIKYHMTLNIVFSVVFIGKVKGDCAKIVLLGLGPMLKLDSLALVPLFPSFQKDSTKRENAHDSWIISHDKSKVSRAT